MEVPEFYKEDHVIGEAPPEARAWKPLLSQYLYTNCTALCQRYYEKIPTNWIWRMLKFPKSNLLSSKNFETRLCLLWSGTDDGHHRDTPWQMKIKHSLITCEMVFFTSHHNTWPGEHRNPIQPHNRLSYAKYLIHISIENKLDEVPKLVHSKSAFKVLEVSEIR